jgi:hypothetical protein
VSAFKLPCAEFSGAPKDFIDEMMKANHKEKASCFVGQAGLFSQRLRAAAGDGFHGLSKFPTKFKVSDRPHATFVCANQRQSPQTRRDARLVRSMP